MYSKKNSNTMASLCASTRRLKKRNVTLNKRLKEKTLQCTELSSQLINEREQNRTLIQKCNRIERASKTDVLDRYCMNKHDGLTRDKIASGNERDSFNAEIDRLKAKMKLYIEKYNDLDEKYEMLQVKIESGKKLLQEKTNEKASMPTVERP
jgi:chromosome segregation ATPase